MDDREAYAMRRGILDDVGHLLREEFAAASWGRLLVEVCPGPSGEIAVANVDVEEIVGDEAVIDAVFGGPGVRALLPVLAKAVEALCALDGLDLEDIRGGTFVRISEQDFAWLAALVRAPSIAFDRERDALLAKLRAKNDRLTERYRFPRGGDVAMDLTRQVLVFTPAPIEAEAGAAPPEMRAAATAIGTFAPGSRSWGWAGSNPHLPEGVRRGSASLVDSILERDMWELSTPAFPTDEPTAWALAALVCERARGDGVFCASEPEGLAFVLLRNVGQTAR
ncbi:MAG: DUF6882 domain-containing protein [Polyangiaceae bacterium]